MVIIANGDGGNKARKHVIKRHGLFSNLYVKKKKLAVHDEAK